MNVTPVNEFQDNRKVGRNSSKQQRFARPSGKTNERPSGIQTRRLSCTTFPLRHPSSVLWWRGKHDEDGEVGRNTGQKWRTEKEMKIIWLNNRQLFQSAEDEMELGEKHTMEKFTIVRGKKGNERYAKDKNHGRPEVGKT